MNIEIMIADETGGIEIIQKKIEDEDYDKVIRELREKLLEQDDNRHIEQVIELESRKKWTKKPTQTNTLNTQTNTLDTQNKDNQIKHRRKK